MTHHNDRLGNGLHDADEVVGRILAHSYRDEIPPVIVWQASKPEHPVKVVGVILAQMAVLLLLFIGIIGWAALGTVPK